jgi:hypothetical protein
MVLLATVVAALAYWQWTEYQKRALHRQVVEFVQDTTEKLRAGLAAAPAPAESTAAIAKWESDAASIERNVDELERAKVRGEGGFVFAAQEYMANSAQALRALAQELRLRQAVAQAEQRLAEHMNGARMPAKAWLDEALRLKAQLEKIYFDYGVAANTLYGKLTAYRDMQPRLATRLEPSLLYDDDSLKAARERADRTAKQTAAEMERARTLPGR